MFLYLTPLALSIDQAFINLVDKPFCLFLVALKPLDSQIYKRYPVFRLGKQPVRKLDQLR
ncbi:MAG: hypothetical protein EOP49_03860 [Sphingobacteriales bacterium]|nr:MAG: hypothetical protein EOP49_03860 [Sphingobacteriales bacterium]